MSQRQKGALLNNVGKSPVRIFSGDVYTTSGAVPVCLSLFGIMTTVWMVHASSLQSSLLSSPHQDHIFKERINGIINHCLQIRTIFFS